MIKNPEKSIFWDISGYNQKNGNFWTFFGKKTVF